MQDMQPVHPVRSREAGAGIGLRARQRLATTKALRDVALRLFDEHGVEATTVEDIAAAAGISTRTFFNYYPTKQDVVLLQVEPAATVLRHAAEAARGPVLDRACAAVLAWAQLFGPEQLDTLRRAARVVATSTLLQSANLARLAEWERILAEALRSDGAASGGAEADRAGNDRAAAVAAAAAVAGLRVAIVEWAVQPEDEAPELAVVVASCLSPLTGGPATPRAKATKSRTPRRPTPRT